MFDMRESVTYQAILQEGRVEEARRLVIRLGQKRFGSPGLAAQLLVERTANLGELEAMLDRLLHAPDWDELVAGST